LRIKKRKSIKGAEKIEVGKKGGGERNEGVEDEDDRKRKQSITLL
jgi:hypothetical protein